MSLCAICRAAIDGSVAMGLCGLRSDNVGLVIATYVFALLPFAIGYVSIRQESEEGRVFMQNGSLHKRATLRKAFAGEGESQS